MAVVDDRGFFITLQAIRRQLAAMPNELYLIRLIHNATRRSVPGERLWTAVQLMSAATVRFLRGRNCDGCDVYVQPYAAAQNPGYILVDLDTTPPSVVEHMRAQGHDPCVVLETSPGHLQAWVRISTEPLEPAVATAAGRLLARAYGGDPASVDWRHLGRLAGFTNQKPARRTPYGFAPWVKIVHAAMGLAPRAEVLLHAARQWVSSHSAAGSPTAFLDADPSPIAASQAVALYQACLLRWRIRQRFPQPDWSIVDLWVARHLLSQGTPPGLVLEVLRLASPDFPRRHSDPGDYLRRTVAHAAFSSPPPTV